MVAIIIIVIVVVILSNVCIFYFKSLSVSHFLFFLMDWAGENGGLLSLGGCEKHIVGMD